MILHTYIVETMQATQKIIRNREKTTPTPQPEVITVYLAMHMLLSFSLG